MGGITANQRGKKKKKNQVGLNARLITNDKKDIQLTNLYKIQLSKERITDIESEWIKRVRDLPGTKTHEIVKFIIVKTCIIYVTPMDYVTQQPESHHLFRKPE